MLGGLCAFAAGGYGGSRLGELLPVQCVGPLDRIWEPRGEYLEPEGWLGKELFSPWDSGRPRPVCPWWHKVDKLKRGARIAL